MNRIFPSLVASTSETQLELWGKPVLGGYVDIIYLDEGRRENHSNKSQLSDVLKILMADNGVQSGRSETSRVENRELARNIVQEERFSNNSV